MNGSAPLFSCEHIRFTYPASSQPVLNDISLALYQGESIGIIGHNGSGKSTLLHIGAGLLTPDAGTVRHQGIPCRTEKDFITARRQLGYLLQRAEDQLFCTTVLEDVAFGPYNLGYSEAEAEAKAWAVLRNLSLDHLALCNGQRLSGGEQKLAALASILAMDVAMLFLDEPTGSLDENARELLLSILRQYNLPSIIISHDTAFLQACCSRFLFLKGGELFAAEAP